MAELDTLMELQSELSQKQMSVRRCGQCPNAVLSEDGIYCSYRNNNPIEDCFLLSSYLNM